MTFIRFAVTLLQQRFFAEPPVTPGGDEARRWAEEELSRSVYQEAKPTLLGKLLNDALNWFRNLVDVNFSAPPSQTSVVWVGVAVLVVVVAAIFIVRPRLNAQAPKQGLVFEEDNTKSAADFRSEAELAQRAGELSAAAIAWFRAAVKTAEERTVIDAKAGRTASEAAAEIGKSFVSEQAELHRASVIFSAIVYGQHSVTPVQVQQLSGLESRLRALKPERHKNTSALPAVPQ
ncbi:DUF4129 domain-containing protein [Pseudarthrobacter sp. J1738]|uniref:DUF4129 domain-containing protein n=1 Tax=Pseudarthrobacter sp. J1738 TaxID=3420446 RepID=UPI003D2B3900